MNTTKIFIIGLPRTGTTSVCNAFLQLGFKTAHTAYTKKCFETAQVIADTPIFNDYQYLDSVYPGAKFIYLEREMSLWLPSIRQLLTRMHTNLMRKDGGFNPHIKRCYLEIFKNLNVDNIESDEYLTGAYNRHADKALCYFSNRNNDFLKINISSSDSFKLLCNFLNCSAPAEVNQFEKMNIAGKVTAWNNVKHPLKISSTAKGKIDSVIY